MIINTIKIPNNYQMKLYIPINFLQIRKDITPINLVYKILWFVGVLNQKGESWSYLFAVYHLVVMKILVISTILLMFLGDPDSQEIIHALSWITISSHIYGKVVNMLCHQTRVRRLLDRMEEIRNEIYRDEKYREILVESEDFLFKLIEYFCSFFVSFPIASLIMNLIQDHFNSLEKPRIIVPMWVPWNMKESWYYLAGMLYITVFPITTCSVYAAFSIFQFTFTLQISAFVKVLRTKLKNDWPENRNLYRDHADIIRLIEEYNDLFTGQLYFEILVSSLQPCGFGYNLIKMIKRNDPAAFDFIYKILLAFSAPFTVCACGQIIQNQFEKLHYSAYQSSWYKANPPNRRDMALMLLLTSVLRTTSYRRFVVFDFACYATVLQGVYSYLMMINQFGD